jgi:Putative prokaryotic signal transducing protein
MTDDPGSPEVLTTAPTDMEAAAIVSALDAHGIQAITTGGYIAGFRAEAPAVVNVIVRHEDLARAKQVLADINQGTSAIDWSQVDVGEAEDPAG